MKPFDSIFAVCWAILIGIFAGKQEWGWVAFSVSFLIVHLVDSAIEVLRERKHK
jgi:hypothetical protein